MQNFEVGKEEVKCPACIKKKRDTNLQLKQINFDCAVYLCPIKKCRYPKGYPWLITKRTFEELTDSLTQKKQEKETNKTNTSPPVKKDKFLNNLIKERKHDENEVFNSILNDLNTIAIDNLDTTDVVSHEQLTTETFEPKNCPDIDDLLNSSENLVPGVNDSFTPLNNISLDANNMFSTSVNEVLEDFMTFPDLQMVDLSMDDVFQF